LPGPIQRAVVAAEAARWGDVLWEPDRWAVWDEMIAPLYHVLHWREYQVLDRRHHRRRSRFTHQWLGPDEEW
jgi:hypothetical protein